MYSVEKIKSDFKRVLNYALSFNIDDTAIDTIFDSWYSNKQKFIRAFGDNLTYISENQSFPLNDREKEKIIRDFKDEMASKYWLSTQKFGTLFSFFDHLTYEEFFSNHIVEPCVVKKINGEVLRMNKGLRISKALKMLNVFEDDEIEEIQKTYSSYIQQGKIEGKLIVSVHPLDFLSASESTYNWRSCHSLNGDFACGNIQYMMDDTTFMVYLLSNDDKEVILPNFPDSVPWNSKKWRTYLFLKDEVLLRGNSYPYHSDELLNETLNLLQSIGLINSSMSSWEKANRTETLEDKVYNDDLKCQLYFNDLLNHSTYRPHKCINKIKYHSTSQWPKFKIGKDIPCLSCGLLYGKNRVGKCVYCSGELYRCDGCGRDIYNYQYNYKRDGKVYCMDCAINVLNVKFCTTCGAELCIDSNGNEYCRFCNQINRLFCGFDSSGGNSDGSTNIRFTF